MQKKLMLELCKDSTAGESLDNRVLCLYMKCFGTLPCYIQLCMKEGKQMTPGFQQLIGHPFVKGSEPTATNILYISQDTMTSQQSQYISYSFAIFNTQQFPRDLNKTQEKFTQ